MWRTFDVGSVIESLPFRDVMVLAGAEGVRRRVSGARLITSPDQVRHIDANEFVVAAVATLAQADGDWNSLLSHLDTLPVAGIVIRLDRADDLTADARATADRLSLPLISVPADTALADVVVAILDELVAAQTQRLERLVDTHERFTRIGLTGGGTADIAAMLHDLLGFPVAVFDDSGRPAVVVPPDLGDELERDATADTRRPIRAGDHDYGEIVVLSKGNAIDDDGIMVLERAATAVAVRLAQASAAAEAHERFAAVSLEELIAGHAGDAADVAERAITFGWDLARPRALLLASIDPPEEGNIPASALNTIAAAARATLGRDAIVWTRSATIAALLAPNTDAPAERRRIAESLRLELDEQLRSVTVSIGVGRRVDKLAELPRSFVEASRAVDVGRWAKGRHVTEVFDELGLERLLAVTPTDDLSEFVQRAIGSLVEYDKANQTDLVETLAAWLDTRNIAEAARRLHVHYNTLKNRLERVEAIIGPVLADGARALECEVAIYVARHYDMPWTGPA